MFNNIKSMIRFIVSALIALCLLGVAFGPAHAQSIGAWTFGSETISDNSCKAPGESFTKTWTLTVVGDGSQWGATSTSLVFYSGIQMGGSSPLNFLSSTVGNGTSVTISIPLTAPTTPGTFKGEWQVKNNGMIVPSTSSKNINSVLSVLIRTDCGVASGGNVQFNGQAVPTAITARPNSIVAIINGQSVPATVVPGANWMMVTDNNSTKWPVYKVTTTVCIKKGGFLWLECKEWGKEEKWLQAPQLPSGTVFGSKIPTSYEPDKNKLNFSEVAALGGATSFSTLYVSSLSGEAVLSSTTSGGGAVAACLASGACILVVGAVAILGTGYMIYYMIQINQQIATLQSSTFAGMATQVYNASGITIYIPPEWGNNSITPITVMASWSDAYLMMKTTSKELVLSRGTRVSASVENSGNGNCNTKFSLRNIVGQAPGCDPVNILRALSNFYSEMWRLGASQNELLDVVQLIFETAKLLLKL